MAFTAADQKKVRVLIVDDSALVRRLLTDILSADPLVDVIDTASDALVAREKIKRYNPDVITLDVEMPKMDGLTFLGHLMRLHPMPVVMVSSLTERGANITLDALEIGAVDFITKPAIDLAHTFEDYKFEITQKVKAAPEAYSQTHRYRVKNPRPRASAAEARKPGLGFAATEQIVAIGASTGGTEALQEVICALPGSSPGTVVVQHIPAAFSAQYARRLNAKAAMNVKEAEDGDRILVGHVYIAPGDRHLQVMRDGATYRCVLSDASPVNRHKPSVDVLFNSVADAVGSNALGVILTGMGKDGSLGLLAMHEGGAKTIAQDEETSVVWGMPGSAVALGAVDDVLPLEKIAAKLRMHFGLCLKASSAQQEIATVEPAKG